MYGRHGRSHSCQDHTPGVYLPPLSQGEEAIINLLRMEILASVAMSQSAELLSEPLQVKALRRVCAKTIGEAASRIA